MNYLAEMKKANLNTELRKEERKLQGLDSYLKKA